MLHRYELPARGLRFTSPRGAGEVCMVTPTLLFYAMYGHLSTELGEDTNAGLEQVTKGIPRLSVFVNLFETTGYDAGCRAVMGDWVIANMPRFSEFHVLVRSKIVSMAVAVTSLASGGRIRSHSTFATFEAALIQAGGKALVETRGATRHAGE